MRERDARNLEQGLNVGGVHLVPGGADAVYERPLAAGDVEHAAAAVLLREERGHRGMCVRRRRFANRGRSHALRYRAGLTLPPRAV